MVTLFRKNLSELTFCILFISILLFNTTAKASCREFQLFDQAYNSYLSYRPEKAVEGFMLFLEEFPDSSAKDAALFWLAKALLQTKSVEEARKTFAYIKEQFPESPFIRYITQELEMIGNRSEEHSSVKVTFDAKAVQKPVVAEIPVIPAARDIATSSELEHDEKTTFYALQVGSFKTEEPCMILKKRLQKKKLTKKIIICRQGDYYKVRITGFHNIEEVNSVLKSGIDGIVVKTSEGACSPYDVSP
jgi:tetratricopeptide (TPR) repeat protein